MYLHINPPMAMLMSFSPGTPCAQHAHSKGLTQAADIQQVHDLSAGAFYSDSYSKNNECMQYDLRVSAITARAAEVKAAKHILVIGGGITGLEIAAEAAEASDADVTLVHSGSRLGASDKQHKLISQRLQKQGVRVLLNERATASDDAGKTFKLDGKNETFDVVFMCTGNKVDARFTDPLGDVVANGRIEVNSFLQVLRRSKL
jgi:NADPH-dependent 2,4-dienoyl-CoA reductase/sulfur reductase-like enzyme